MELVGVRIELPSNQPIVLLREVEGSRYLPIWIGAVEATAIAYALEGILPQRPMTHDLLKNATESLGATVSRVIVTELRENVFFADLVFSRNGDEVRVSSRPSDAIALAARSGAPLFANAEVLDEAGIELRDDDEEEAVARMREFLDRVTPSDFEGGPAVDEQD
ncbi:MAG TPA: bifunctional nuclease family protein [Acidimicrobiia bacterium]